MATNPPSSGDTVNTTKTSTLELNQTKIGHQLGCRKKIASLLARAESTPAARKRPLIQESSSPKTEVPPKSPRRGDSIRGDEPGTRGRHEIRSTTNPSEDSRGSATITPESGPDLLGDNMMGCQTTCRNVEKRTPATASPPVRFRTLKRAPEDNTDDFESSGLKNYVRDDRTLSLEIANEISRDSPAEQIPVIQNPQVHRQFSRRDEAVKLRKTIQWLEEGARRMREDLAATRAQLHEERRAARLTRRELESAVKDAKLGEAARHMQIIAELKFRLAQSPTRGSSVDPASTASLKAESIKDENHRRELSALRKRLAEAEANVQKLKANACSPQGSGKRRKVENTDSQRLGVEVQALRATNKKLEQQLQVVAQAERKRGAELRIQHETHEAQLAALQRTIRGDTIKMMEEIRSKTREIEKLEKLVLENCQMNRKLQTKEDDLMRKLRETERSNQVRLVPRVEDKLTSSTDHVVNSCHGDCDAATEVERLREFTVEQQEVIEVLRQAVKEKERKLDQISNKKRKEEFYKQWLELEPVVEVEDEEEHEHEHEHEREEGDSALSSAPSSLSPQPGVCGPWQHSGVTREAYEAVLREVEELQTRLFEEQRELAHAKSQVRDLEKALLQETRGSQHSRRALSDKLREIEDREANLVAEISELREQNELLEFRVLELEESPCSRETPDPADSGIVSPEPIHLYKDQLIKHKDRAVATVIPYNTYGTHSPVSPIPQKPPLSLQESGIFDEEEDDAEVELASCGTQTETPAGDLLQEVRRLHELRARIQERAVKVPVPDVTVTVAEATEGGQATWHQERIRELEQRLEAYEEAENKRTRDKILSKQREEDLLDENYRLAEKIYWLENILRNSKNLQDDEKVADEVAESLGSRGKCSEVDEDREAVNTLTLDPRSPASENRQSNKCDADSSSEATVREPEEVSAEYSSKLVSSSKSPVSGVLGESWALDSADARSECNECGRKGKTRTERLDRELAGGDEISRRRKIAELERREATYIATLQKADETLALTKLGYSTRLEQLGTRLELELSTNEKLVRRVTELEDTIKCLRRRSVCEGDLVRRNHENCSGGVDEVDPCPSRRDGELRKCELVEGTRIIVPMEVDDQYSDVPDGSSARKRTLRSAPSWAFLREDGHEDERSGVGFEANNPPKLAGEARNSVSPTVLAADLVSRPDTTARVSGVSTVLVPEIVAELAVEAREDEQVRFVRSGGDAATRLDNIPEINGNAEVTGEVEERWRRKRQKGEEDEEASGVDAIAEGEEAKADVKAEAEAVVTIDETEPAKKVIYFRWR